MTKTTNILARAAMTLLLAVLCYAGALAQETRHEVAFTYGIASNSQILNIYEDLVKAPFSGSASQEKDWWFGPISMEYFYHLSNRFSLGAIAVYGHKGSDLYENSTKRGELSANYLSLLPGVKFSWWSNDYLGLYSKAAVGITYRTEKVDAVNYSENEVRMNWQLSAIGFEGGSLRVRGFAELGFGEQGIFFTGVRFKF